MEFHPLANVFPLMEGEEFDGLKASIKSHGVREPIVLFEDRVLDGRNRFRACKELGIEIPAVKFSGDEPTAFVIDKNIHRRHLTASQRAMIAANIAKIPHGQTRRWVDAENSASMISIREAAAMLNVDKATVSDARKILSDGTSEEIEQVTRGETAVSTLARQIRRGEKEVERQKYKPEAKRQNTKQLNAQLWHQFKDAINNITGLPHVEDAVRIIRGHDKAGMVNERLPSALQWMKDFSDEWNRDRA